MNGILNAIVLCIERGKINAASAYPPDLKNADGVSELTKKALEDGISPNDILWKGLIVGMNNIGEAFHLNKVFVPDVLMAAKAFSSAMVHIKPFFTSGHLKYKGTFVIGTVLGDIHDIGKSIVSMMVEGTGWKVIDLGIDVSPQRFVNAIIRYPGCVVGLSALLTTTMKNMANAVGEIKKKFPYTQVIVGGAPLTSEFAVSIGADKYASGPQKAVEFFNNINIGDGVDATSK